jgi:hypothetical protein
MLSHCRGHEPQAALVRLSACEPAHTRGAHAMHELHQFHQLRLLHLLHLLRRDLAASRSGGKVVLGVAAVLSLAYLFGAPRRTLTVELGEGVGLGFLGGVLLYVVGGLTRETEMRSAALYGDPRRQLLHTAVSSMPGGRTMCQLGVTGRGHGRVEAGGAGG